MNSTENLRESARNYIIDQLVLLRNDHLEYAAKFKKNAKTDTLLMLDYYQQSEFILKKSVPRLIRELSRNHGKRLKDVLQVQDDASLIAILKFRDEQAEKSVGRKLWTNVGRLDQSDLENLLGQEDAAVLERVIGLRNDWKLSNDPVSVSRRTRAGFSRADVNKSDEKRIDTLLNNLLVEDAALLKSFLQVDTAESLRTALRALAPETDRTGQRLEARATLREILNFAERAVVHKILGLERTRFIGFLPPHYARQIRAGIRSGFYDTFLSYVNELGIHVGGVGESGTPFYPWAALVHQQMMIELIAVLRNSAHPGNSRTKPGEKTLRSATGNQLTIFQKYSSLWAAAVK